MYRVELKGTPNTIEIILVLTFLMYRVELKAKLHTLPPLKPQVPNVPCGVESLLLSHNHMSKSFVPNVPCGVESQESKIVSVEMTSEWFLMYRVELKACSHNLFFSLC